MFIPGCVMTKEMNPDPRVVQSHFRGMHMLAIDGPGQGMSNIRGIKLNHGNYERAVLEIAGWLRKDQLWWPYGRTTGVRPRLLPSGLADRK